MNRATLHSSYFLDEGYLNSHRYSKLLIRAQLSRSVFPFESFKVGCKQLNNILDVQYQRTYSTMATPIMDQWMGSAHEHSTDTLQDVLIGKLDSPLGIGTGDDSGGHNEDCQGRGEHVSE